MTKDTLAGFFRCMGPRLRSLRILDWQHTILDSNLMDILGSPSLPKSEGLRVRWSSTSWLERPGESLQEFRRKLSGSQILVAWSHKDGFDGNTPVYSSKETGKQNSPKKDLNVARRRSFLVGDELLFAELSDHFASVKVATDSWGGGVVRSSVAYPSGSSVFGKGNFLRFFFLSCDIYSHALFPMDHLLFVNAWFRTLQLPNEFLENGHAPQPFFLLVARTSSVY